MSAPRKRKVRLSFGVNFTGDPSIILDAIEHAIRPKEIDIHVEGETTKRAEAPSARTPQDEVRETVARERGQEKLDQLRKAAEQYNLQHGKAEDARTPAPVVELVKARDRLRGFFKEHKLKIVAAITKAIDWAIELVS
jgi:hypothetical protein